MKTLFTNAYYNEFKVTRWLPTAEELIQYFNERNGKASKTRFINESLREALKTREDLINALKDSPNGMLNGAHHTHKDLAIYNDYIQNIENLKTI
jgi:hypothetical protein